MPRTISRAPGVDGSRRNRTRHRKKSLRQDLYKKICSSDSISFRPPYAKSTKILSPRCSVRFEINGVLVSSNVKEESWDIIYRRSLVIAMKEKLRHIASTTRYRLIWWSRCIFHPMAIRYKGFPSANLRERRSSI